MRKNTTQPTELVKTKTGVTKKEIIADYNAIQVVDIGEIYKRKCSTDHR